MVEFALAGSIFLLIVFGTIDFGRIVFTYSQLDNAVREGARYGKVHCADTANIKNRVIEKAVTINLTTADVAVATSGGCVPPAGRVTVSATTTFQAVSQSFLGLAPFTLVSSATVDVE